MPSWSEGLGDYKFGQLDLSLDDAWHAHSQLQRTKRISVLEINMN